MTASTNMERIFYFHGRAGDLPTALLRHETAELKKLNVALGHKLAKPLNTISELVRAAQVQVNGPTDKRGASARSRAIRNIIHAGN